ncbi:hypothetical protein ACFY2R_19615 [Micromonospora olivasterospora]|nr:hypothetical protein [Micromonospora olivasterospora]
MSNAELANLAAQGGPYRGKAVFELVDRARVDDAAAGLLDQLSRLPALRRDRVHLVSLAWAAIIGLLAAETPEARKRAYAAFAALDPAEQADFLSYVRAERIEDAHPRV